MCFCILIFLLLVSMVSFIYKLFAALLKKFEKFPRNQTVYVGSVFFIVHKSYVIARVIVNKSYLSFFIEKGSYIFQKLLL